MFNFIKKYINKNEIINDSTLLFYDKKDILNLNFKNDNFNNNNLHYFEVINEYLNKTIKKEEKLSYENFINVLFFSFDNEILCEFLPIDFQNNSTDKLKLILNFIETKKYGNKFLHPDKATYSYKFDKILTEVLSCSNIFKLFYSLNLNKTNFDDMGKIVNFIFSLATKFVNKDNEIIVQLSYNVMEMDNKERTNQLGYLTVNLINNCYQEKVKKISDDESVFSLLFNVFSFIPLDYNNYNFEYLNNIFEKMSQQILNEAIIFTSNHEINKDYSKNKHNTLSKEEVLQMFYEDKIEILYKYIGIIFNSISDNYNNNYKSAFEFLNLIEKYYFYKLEFNSKTHEDNLSLKDDIKNIFQSNSNPYKPFNDSNVKIVSKFNSNEKYNYYENKKFKNLIKKFIYNISTIEFINNNDKFFNEIFVDNFKYFNVIPHLNIFDKLFLYKNKERDIEIFLNFLLDNCNTLNDLENKNIDKQQIKTINLDNYNYQFISFFNYLKTHELNTRNKDNLIHFIKENNYQYADLKEYLNFYLDLFQLNYPIVFNKLNFMDNYNKINLKLDVVFNIKQSNKKLNKKINI